MSTTVTTGRRIIQIGRHLRAPTAPVRIAQPTVARGSATDFARVGPSSKLVAAPRVQAARIEPRERIALAPLAVLGMLRDGRMDIDIPLVPGPLVELLGISIVEVRPGTHLRIRLDVRDGLICTDRVWHRGRDQWATQAWFVDAKGEMSAIDGPLWIKGRGAYIDDEHRLRADIQGFFDVNVSPFVANGKRRTPARLADFLALFAADGGPEITVVKPPGSRQQSGGNSKPAKQSKPGRIASLLKLDETTIHFDGIDNSNPARLSAGRIELGDGSFVRLEEGTEVSVHGRPRDLKVSLRGRLDDLDLGHQAMRLRGKNGTLGGTLSIYDGPSDPTRPALELQIDELSIEDVVLTQVTGAGVNRLEGERLVLATAVGEGVRLTKGGKDAGMTLSMPMTLAGAHGRFFGLTDGIGSGELVLGRERPATWTGRINYDAASGLDVRADVDHLDATVAPAEKGRPGSANTMERIGVAGAASISIHADRDRMQFDANAALTADTELHVGPQGRSAASAAFEAPLPLPTEPLGEMARATIPIMRALPPPPQFAKPPRFELLQPSAPPQVVLWPTQALRGIEQVLVEISLPAQAMDLPFEFGEVRTKSRLGIDDTVGTVASLAVRRPAGPVRLNLGVRSGQLIETDCPLVEFDPPVQIPAASLTSHLPYAPGEVSLTGSLRVHALKLIVDEQSGRGYLEPLLDIEDLHLSAGDEPQPGDGLAIRRLFEKLDRLARHVPMVGEGGILGMMLGKAIFGTYPLPLSTQDLMTGLEETHPGLADKIEIPLWDPPVPAPPSNIVIGEAPLVPRLLDVDEIQAQPGTWYVIEHGVTTNRVAERMLMLLEIDASPHRIEMVAAEITRLNRLGSEASRGMLTAGAPLRMPKATSLRNLLGVPAPTRQVTSDSSPLGAVIDIDMIQVRVSSMRFASHTIDLGGGQYIHFAAGSQIDVDVQPGPPRSIRLRGRASFAPSEGEPGGLRIGTDPLSQERPDGTFGLALDDGTAQIDLFIEQSEDPNSGPRVSMTLDDLSATGLRAAAQAKGVRTVLRGPDAVGGTAVHGATITVEIPGNGPRHIRANFPEFVGQIAARGELRPLGQPNPFSLDVAGSLTFDDGAVSGELSRVNLSVRGLDLRNTDLVAFGSKPIVMGDRVSLRGPVVVNTDDRGHIVLSRPTAGPNAGQAMVLDAALTMLDGSSVQIMNGQASSLKIDVAQPEIDIADVTGDLDLLMRVGPDAAHIDVPNAHARSGRLVIGSNGINVEDLALTKATGRIGNISTGSQTGGLAFEQLNFDDQDFNLTYTADGEVAVTTPDGTLSMSPSPARLDDIVLESVGLSAGLDPKRTQIASADIEEIHFDSKNGGARWDLRNVVVESLVHHLDIDLAATTKTPQSIGLRDGKLRIELHHIEGALGSLGHRGVSDLGFLGTVRIEGAVTSAPREAGTLVSEQDRRMVIDASGHLRAIGRVEFDSLDDIDAKAVGTFDGDVRVQTPRAPAR